MHAALFRAVFCISGCKSAMNSVLLCSGCCLIPAMCQVGVGSLGGYGLGTYNFAALNRWDKFRVWLGHGMGLFPETFLKCCGGVTGLGTHISPNHLLE